MSDNVTTEREFSAIETRTYASGSAVVSSWETGGGSCTRQRLIAEFSVQNMVASVSPDGQTVRIEADAEGETSTVAAMLRFLADHLAHFAAVHPPTVVREMKGLMEWDGAAVGEALSRAKGA